MAKEIGNEADRRQTVKALKALEVPPLSGIDLSSGSFPVTAYEAGRGATFKVATGGVVNGKTYRTGDFICSDGTAFTLLGISEIDKAALGLDQVDNTADSDKPISTALLQALQTKLSLGQLQQASLVIYGDDQAPGGSVWTFSTDQVVLAPFEGFVSIADGVRFYNQEDPGSVTLALDEATLLTDSTIQFPAATGKYLAVTSQSDGSLGAEDLPSVAFRDQPNAFSAPVDFNAGVSRVSEDTDADNELVRVGQVSRFSNGARFPHQPQGPVSEWFNGTSIPDTVQLIENGANDTGFSNNWIAPGGDYSLRALGLRPQENNTQAIILPRNGYHQSFLPAYSTLRTVFRVPLSPGAWGIVFGLTGQNPTLGNNGLEGFMISGGTESSDDYKLYWGQADEGVGFEIGWGDAFLDLLSSDLSAGDWVALEIFSGPASIIPEVTPEDGGIVSPRAIKAWRIDNAGSYQQKPTAVELYSGNVTSRQTPLGSASGPSLLVANFDQGDTPVVTAVSHLQYIHP